jgi:hypothetical protein
MVFEDPIQTVIVDLPPGWTYNPFDSTLTDFYFNVWNRPGSMVGVHVRPASVAPQQPDEQWVEEIRSQVLDKASISEMSLRNGCAVTADFTPGKGLAQRVVFIRGPRVELVIEQRNTSSDPENSWTPLERAVQSALSTANLKEAEPRGPGEFNRLVEAGNEAFERKDYPAAADALKQAIEIGTSAWLASLTPPVGSPELHAAVGVGQVMLHLASITGNLAMHRGAETVLRRALCTLESIGQTSETQQLMTDLSETLRYIMSELLEGAEGEEGTSQILAMRERSFRLAHGASQAFESSDLEHAHSLSGMAMDDLLTVLSYLRRNPLQDVPEEIAAQLADQGITDPASQLVTIGKAREASLFPPLCLSLRIRYNCALEQEDSSLLEATDILVRLSDFLCAANPANQGMMLAHALALTGRAVALALQTGDESLSEAIQYLDKAAQILESIQERHANDDGWIQFHDRHLEGSLQAIDRSLARAGERGNSMSKEKLLQVRAHLESIAGQFRSRVGDLSNNA